MTVQNNVDMKKLHPVLQEKVKQFCDKLVKADIGLLIYCGYRSNAEQDALYAQGRTVAGKIVTMAKAGQSKHNFTINGKPASKAFDCVPMRYGKPVWGNSSKQDIELWNAVAEIGESVGLEWAGRWKRFREFPHFQIS